MVIKAVEMQRMQPKQPGFKITYCVTCGFKSRAEELQADLEKNFAQRAELIQESGGLFEVEYGDQVIFSKKSEERFPEPGEIVNIVLELKRGSALEDAQKHAEEKIPKPPTFEEWFNQNR
jgi:selT/selW/selH-like putative selenoprotein